VGFLFDYRVVQLLLFVIIYFVNIMKRNKGFTLIELLVVIAIIGILSAIVLASLNTARNKSKDAATQSQLASMRAQAELYYNSQSPLSYTGVCNAALGASGFGGAAGPGLLFAAAKSDALGDLTLSINVNAGSDGTGTTVSCNDADNGWAVEAPVVGSAIGTPIMWCVDNTGTSRQETSNLASGATTCA